MADPYFSSVVLLAVNDNAIDGSTTFVDQSTSAKTLTAHGNIQYDTASAPTGMTSSALSDGTGDFAGTASSADFAFGTGDFTIEMMLNTVANNGVICTTGNGGAATEITFYIFTSGTPRYYNQGDKITGAAIKDGAWHHVALSRVSGSTKLFIDGTQSGSTYADSRDYNLNKSFNFCADDAGGLSWNGWMSNIRVTKGVGRYTTTFTPPTLPMPITAVDAPVADFSGTPLSGTAPLSVAFTDLSTNTPTSWAWTFGDGDTDTVQNPLHAYASAGTYTVGLTATNAAGSDLETKTDYIAVTAPVVPVVPIAENPIGGGGTRGRQYQRKQTEAEERAERVALGILPAHIEEGEAAVAVAARAVSRVEIAVADGEEMQAALQSEAAAFETYQAVYREYMQADAIIAQFRADIAEHRKQMKRRAAMLLLSN